MVTRLSTEIRRVTADQRLDLRDARALVEAAGPTLSNAEARTLGDLYDSLVSRGAGTAEHPYATRTAFDALARCFADHGQPYGPNRPVVTDRLREFFLVQGLGAPLAQPPRTTGLPEIVLRDARPSDGTRDTVFLDAAHQRAWLRLDGGGRARPPDRWYGPFDVSKPPVAGPDQPQIQPRPADLGADRSGYLGATLRAAVEGGAAHFEQAGLPVGPRLFDLGVLMTERRDGGVSYRGYLVDDGRPSNELDRYWIRREVGGAATFAGPLAVPPFVDPLGDGLLTYPNRAKELYYRLSFGEHLDWQDQGPGHEIHLARGKRVAGVDPYFVIPRRADGTDADPDTATEVWFRQVASRKWAGPHAL